MVFCGAEPQRDSRGRCDVLDCLARSNRAGEDEAGASKLTEFQLGSSQRDVHSDKSWTFRQGLHACVDVRSLTN